MLNKIVLYTKAVYRNIYMYWNITYYPENMDIFSFLFII